MTHSRYTAQYLRRQTLATCKAVAKSLGITPKGDKRQKSAWVDAIIEHQSVIEPVEENKPQATIKYDDSLDGTIEGEYVLIVNNEVVERFRTYIKAERFALNKYELISSQEATETELEAENVTQGDEKQDYPERGRDVTCANEYWDLEFDVKNTNNQVEEIMGHRGSGRRLAIEEIPTTIEEMGMIIENTFLFGDNGHAFAVLQKGDWANVMYGYIFYSEKGGGWTLHGESYENDWKPIASQLLKENNVELLVAV